MLLEQNNNKLCRKLHIFLLILLLSNCCMAFTYKSLQDCKEIQHNSSCQCSTVLSDLEVSCPASALNPSIAVRIREGMHVQIECDKLDANKYSLLPAMTIGDCPMVLIKQCPLPGHTPIVKIFHKLGITNVNSLIFESNNLDINLTREHLSGLHNLGRLRFSSKSLTHLPEDIFNDVRNLTWLDLRWNEIELPKNIFAVLENLNFLELGHNNLQNLPTGIFRNQRQLIHLNLWSNQLRNLTRDVFMGASSIADLDLSSNGIERFEPNVFALLTNLSNINLNGNYFSELPEGLFAHNHNLTQFRLINNRVPLRTLPTAFLANLPQLREIRLTCDLETLPGDLFANSTAITNITITGNQLVTLPDDLLTTQNNLLDLDLRRNRLQTLPDTLLQNTPNLISLKLSQNKLHEISSYLFAQLSKLEYLYMDNNQLKTIHTGAFGATRNLRLINMENNELDFSDPLAQLVEDLSIQDFPSPFQQLTSLHTLNLRNNSVMFIFSDWKILQNLQILDLSYNNISTLSDIDLQFLIRNNMQVNLTHNQIHYINFYGIESQTPPVFGVTMNFDLGYNPLNCNCVLLTFVQFLHNKLNENLGKYVRLNTDDLVCESPINLKGRHVRNVSAMELLCPLDTEDAKEKHCPKGCQCFTRPYDSVLMVNCSNSNLTKVPALPRRENYTTELYINNSTLKKLPENNAPGYKYVTKIYAANNNLTSLESRQLPPALTHLDLRYNKIKVLNSTAINYFNISQYLESLKLSGNPWQCNCETKGLLQFSLRNQHIEDLKEMNCYMPSGELKALTELSLNDICPVDTALIIAIAVVISLMGFLLGLIAALYYKYREEILMFLYQIPCLRCLFPEELVDEKKLFDCFLSYSHKDEKFVADVLLKELEKFYTTCVHGRDWLPGECIPDNIDRAVDESRRTIVVLSQHFIESSWSRMEFRNAHKKALEERRPRVIVIVYGDLDMESLDHELKAYVNMYTYLKWGEPWFWKRLFFALPHYKHKNENNGLVKNPLKGSTDDKLELIKPSPVAPPLTTPPGETTKNPLVAHLNGGTPQTAVLMQNEKIGHGLPNYYTNGRTTNGHINGAFIINTNAKQSDV